MDPKHAKAAALKKAAMQRMQQISLTPADMSQNDIAQKAMGMGMIDPTVPLDQQVQGGVSQPPANILSQVPAGQGAPAPAPVAAPAPQTPIGPGVTVAPPVITPAPAPAMPPQAGLMPPAPSGSDMPDPHAPEPADEPIPGEDGDEDDDEGYAGIPYSRMV